MEYVTFFLYALWYTLGPTLLCGLMVYLCCTLFVRMLGGGVGRGVVIGTSIIGTPIHELGHAVMCLLFGHRITEIRLWQPSAPGGNLGYVTHSYHKRNPYHILGNLFIGIGPIFSGLAVLTLTLFLAFPSALSSYMDAAETLVSQGESSFVVFFEGLKMLPEAMGDALTSDTVPLWGRIIGVVVLLSVALHIELSPADIKGALGAIPLYLVLILLLTLVTGLLGSEAMDAVTAALAMFSAVMTSLFTIVIVVCLAELIIALPVWVLRLVLGRR